jgi:hypothetical protein
MPFVPQSERDNPDMRIAGSRCYVEYKFIMARWKANPRWTTVDELAERLYPNPFKRAFFLAFLVHFATHVLNYEEIKKRENGDIE